MYRNCKLIFIQTSRKFIIYREKEEEPAEGNG